MDHLSPKEEAYIDLNKAAPDDEKDTGKISKRSPALRDIRSIMVENKIILYRF